MKYDKYEYVIITKQIIIYTIFYYFHHYNIEISMYNTEKYAIMNYVKLKCIYSNVWLAAPGILKSYVKLKTMVNWSTLYWDIGVIVLIYTQMKKL
jgi:hypothetical protein